jgi:hypothetical protein
MYNLWNKEKYKHVDGQHSILKLKNASENVGKDELSNPSFDLRVDKLFHHIRS